MTRTFAPRRPHRSLPAALVCTALLAMVPVVGPLEAEAQLAALPACSLGARLGLRPEGACVQHRQGLLPTPVEVGSASGDLPRLLSVEVSSRYRSAYPSDRNDGLAWAGRGVSASAAAGVGARIGPVSLALRPEIAWSQNRSFALPDSTPPGWSRWADPWSAPGADRFLRPGSGAWTQAGPGDSYVEVAGGPARGGLSTERLWWGPARRYPLLFSGTAAGFPHAYLETMDPVAAGPGGVDLRVLAGRLDESPWFDADEGNDHRLLTAGQVAWRLGFVPGLEVALSAVRHQPWDAPGDQGVTLGTFSFRLAFPEEGMEAYGEIGRGDFFVNGVAGVSDTRHAQVYTLGLTRSDTTSGGVPWRFWGELTKQTMELPQPRDIRRDTAYVGPPVPQGHTHGGQFLGAWIGPGSNAQAMGLDFPGSRGAVGFFAERVRRDDDTYYRVHYRDYGFRGHDLEWTLGLRGTRNLTVRSSGTIQVGFEGGVSRRKNRSFVGLDGGLNWTWVREWNGWADLTARWYPG